MTNLKDFLNDLKPRLTDDCALLIDLEYPLTLESWARDISEAQAECPEHYILNINEVTKRPIGPEEL